MVALLGAKEFRKALKKKKNKKVILQLEFIEPDDLKKDKMEVLVSQ